MIHPYREQLSDRLRLIAGSSPAQHDGFAEDVRQGLSAPSKHLPPKYFYDALGSTLFEAICELPEYYLTRAETEILESNAADIVHVAGGGAPIEIVELGSGNARKTRLLLEAALAAQERVTYKPIDISPSALLASAEALVASYDRLSVEAFADDYFTVLRSGRLGARSGVLALFLGSNIGNYEPAAAAVLLKTLRGALTAGDGVLLGYDLKKDPSTLELAYNDPTGVTAAFNKNVLGRINRELGGSFDLDAFRHVARYSGRRGSVDSFLVAQRGMRVPIPGAGIEAHFSAFDEIHTESSYKFDAVDIARLSETAGLEPVKTWRDAAGRFAVSLLAVR